MKKLFVLFFLLSLSFSANCQSYNSEKVEFTNFVKRMYEKEPFEGLRVVTDYDNAYMIVAIVIDTKSYPESQQYRLASVKAMSEANRYINGSLIKSEFIYEMKHVKAGKKASLHETIIENIYENSMGYTNSLELLTNIDLINSRRAYIFCKKLSM